MPGEEAFATPQAKKICIDGAGFSATPGRSVTTFEIPPSPCLKRLGFGTGKFSLSPIYHCHLCVIVVW